MRRTPGVQDGRGLYGLQPPGAASGARGMRVAPRASLIREIGRDIREGRRSAVEVAREYLERLSSKEGSINSFITVTAEDALRQAQNVDEAISNGDAASLGPLAGIPIAIKDNICTKGTTTTAGSRVLETYVPPYDSFAAAKLKEAGAVLVGKTNCDEFGMGSSTENSAFKVTRNPWSLEHVPGGSSGGSAAAVAAGQCVAALGSDTGGSVRLPAHFCGVVGLKPTYGRVSRYGLIAFGSSLDTIGSLCPTVEDAAIILNTISGVDSADATSSQEPVPDFSAGLRSVFDLPSQPLAGRRIAVISETLGEGVDDEIVAAVKTSCRHMESLGAVVEEVSIPSFAAGLPAYYVIAVSEASSNLSRYDGVRYGVRQDSNDLRDMYNKTRMSGLGPEVKRRIIMGTYALSAGYYDAYYKRAQQVRTIINNEMTEALDSYDTLVAPTAPTTAYRIGEVSSEPLSMYKGDLMSVNLNMAGLPGIVVRCGFSSASGTKLPIGLQFIGRSFGEKDMINIAHVFEQTADFAAGQCPA
eukprot:evm.model.scf_248EXC.3 EVM.evm.TU.scf_248EXC.3   scf_248EXC:15876-22377(-)